MSDPSDRAKKPAKLHPALSNLEAGQASTSLVLVALILEGNQDEAVKLLEEIRDENDRTNVCTRAIDHLLSPMIDKPELVREFARLLKEPVLKAISFAEAARHSHDSPDILEACRNANEVKHLGKRLVAVKMIAQTIEMWNSGVVEQMRRIIQDPLSRSFLVQHRQGNPTLN